MDICSKNMAKTLPGTWKTLGVAGCTPGCGATHLVFSIASYLAAVSKGGGACVELNHNGAFAELERTAYGKEGSAQIFTLWGVTYVKDAVSADFIHGIYMDYAWVIADLGTDYDRLRPSFLHCDKKVVAADLCPWQEVRLEQFMSCAEFEKGFQDWLYCYTFGRRETARRFEYRYGISMQRVPFQEDIFCLTGKELEFYRQLLYVTPRPLRFPIRWRRIT